MSSAGMKGQRHRPVLRVVLDGPVLLRCLLGQDAVASAARRAWQAGAVQPLVSSATARSLIRALSYPGLGLSAEQQQELLGDFLPYAEVVQVGARRLPGLKQLPQAQQDVLGLAQAGAAQQLLSFHKGLLQWAACSAGRRQLPGCQVLSVVEYFADMR